MTKLLIYNVLFVAAVAAAATAQAQQSKMFGPYELHYTVVNTTFLDPEVASTYGITRGEKRAILNLAVREVGRDKPGESTPGESTPGESTLARSMLLKGRTWDLMQNQFLEFKEIREGPAIYYIADFKYINEEWRFFEIDFRPEGADETFTFKFKHQLYIN